MKDEKLKIIIGRLLHDIGKPVQRDIKNINHSDSGYAFLKDDIGINDNEILEQVKFHHSYAIGKSDILDDSYAYITYIADNIASGADRRKIDAEDRGFQTDMSLQTVYNILNGNKKSFSYRPVTMAEDDGINYPTSDNITFSKEFYSKIQDDLLDCIKGIDIHNTGYINSLLELLEADCSYIPSSTNKSEIADISLYDHLKITAAIGTCIYDYLEYKDIKDYKKCLFDDTDSFYDENAFLMFSFDVSGIQSFIYTIQSKNALKMLRSRSFYVEMLCEHYIDTLLSRLSLSRANLIYSGGGHGYIVLANTPETREILDKTHKEINKWLLDNFGTALYVASAYTECCANDFMNKSEQGYERIFKELSGKLSEEKALKYSAKDIVFLNTENQSGKRECAVCGKTDSNVSENMCSFCRQLTDISNDIIEKDFFAVLNGTDGLPLPFGQCLVGTERDTLTALMKEEAYIRSYCKNKQFTGLNISTKLWIGDYHTEKEFSRLAEKSKTKGAVSKIGIIRADVDNLGQAFVKGFPPEYVSLSRTASFSRSLSLFFKKHINTLLKENGIEATIVYSGGDDVFMVTAWSDTLKAVTVLQEALDKFSIGALTISAGVGLYSPTYPVANMADECGSLESRSKYAGRNRITLFTDRDVNNEEYTYTWDDLKEKVIKEKKEALERYFSNNDDHGTSLIYNLLSYLRNIDDKINIARFAYLLSRIDSDKELSEVEKEKLLEFERKMYDWSRNETDRKQLITAMYLYVYEHREEKNKEEKKI